MSTIDLSYENYIETITANDFTRLIEEQMDNLTEEIGLLVRRRQQTRDIKLLVQINEALQDAKCRIQRAAHSTHLYAETFKLLLYLDHTLDYRSVLSKLLLESMLSILTLDANAKDANPGLTFSSYLTDSQGKFYPLKEVDDVTIGSMLATLRHFVMDALREPGIAREDHKLPPEPAAIIHNTLLAQYLSL